MTCPALETARNQLAASGLFTGVTGPLNPNGGVAHAWPTSPPCTNQTRAAPAAVPPRPAPREATSRQHVYQLYRATGLYISKDGRTVQFETGP